MRKTVLSSVVLAAMSVPLPLASVALGQETDPVRPPATAQQDQPAQQQQAQIPVRQVVLFSSGVGYFEHFGTVQDQRQAELRFKTEQINDILKSLVLQDLDGGSVSTITYPSQDPLAKQLRSFQVDIAANPTLAELLNQLRGARVTVTHLNQTVTGTILGVETKNLPVGDDNGDKEVVETSVLNLLVEGGRLISLRLDDVNAIHLEDPQLQEELTRALSAVAQARDQDKKSVLINFAGEGERRVRLGYVVETPIWKTSYRLILAAEGEEDAEPRLQGWAIVENQTDNDWENVQLSLVSGRPISFVMDLYQPLYVPRPIVEPELFASLRPQTYSAGVREQEMKQQAMAGEGIARLELQRRGLPAQAPGAGAEMDVATAGRAVGGFGGGIALRDGADAYAGIDPTASVSSLASAAEIGELFQYTVGNVTLPRQRSAMIPIITDPVEVEQLSIYNQSVLARHPLTGARIKNTTGKHLLQGPITVFDDNAYAGDAQVNNVPPGQERLVSYGVDLNVLVKAEPKPQEVTLTGAKIVKGVLELTRKHVATQSYTIDNKAEREKSLIVEHPVQHGWTLVEPAEPIETTDTVYRFRQEVPADETVAMDVVQERVTGEAIALLPVDITVLIDLAGNGQIPAPVREALRTAAGHKQRMVDTERAMQQRREEIARITQEQGRMRENMRSVPQNSEYYRRLLSKLDEQETRIEELQVEVAELQDQFNAQRQEFEDYLNGLNVG